MKAALIALTLVFFSGCKVCDASNCTGCCDDTGDCQLGTQKLACGAEGARCLTCTGTEVCDNRVCGPATAHDAGVSDAGMVTICTCATGCCASDGSCMPGNSPYQCGKPRTFCSTCQAMERCESGACTSNKCTGCVDASGHCLAGDQPSACGGSGGICVACLADQTCTANHCVTTMCSPTNCGTGCCDGTVCVSPPTNALCGLGGGSCQICALNQTCMNGSCH